MRPLTRHLDNQGRGLRMEIYPVDQSHAEAEYQRPNIQQRAITVRYLGRLVTAWSNRDQNLVDEIWDDVPSDVDSEYGA